MRIKDLALFNPKGVKPADFINYIDTSSVEEGRLLDVQSLSKDMPSRAQRVVALNDILISSVRPNLKHNYFVDRVIEHCIASTGFIQIRVTSNNVLPRFLYYYLTEDSNVCQYQTIAETSQSTFPSFNKDVIENLDFPDISLQDQQHIVDILGSIDNYIENNSKKIENLINFGQLKYQEDISSNDYEYIALSKLVKISRGASPRPIQNYLTTTGHSWVKISDVTSLSAPFLFETKEYITDEGTNHSVAVYPNDLILSNSATPGIPVFMETNAFVHDGWLIIRYFKRITPNYLFWVLKNDRNIILSQGNGSIFTNLKTDILKSHEIPVPSKEKMEKLDNLYSTILLKIKHLTKENLKLNELKQLYLKKFFG